MDHRLELVGESCSAICRTTEMLPSVPGKTSALDTAITRLSRTAGISGNVLLKYSRVSASCSAPQVENTIASGSSAASDSGVIVAAKKLANRS